MFNKAKKKMRKCTEQASYMLGWTCCGSSSSAFSDRGSSDADTDSEDEDAQFIEVDLLRHDLNEPRKFPNNSIRTAKYTLFTGLPLSLLYQFHKVSNVYFLLVMIISLVPGASPINPFSSIAPLCVVLGAGIIKDLWEDWKRRVADKEANDKIVHVLRGSEFAAVKSLAVRPGDVMLFRLGEEVKADCLILNTSLPDGLTYIETANLDGETNAKTRRAKIQTVELLGTVEDINDVALGGSGHVSSTAAQSNANGGGGVIREKIGTSKSCCGGCDSVDEHISAQYDRASRDPLLLVHPTTPPAPAGCEKDVYEQRAFDRYNNLDCGGGGGGGGGGGVSCGKDDRNTDKYTHAARGGGEDPSSSAHRRRIGCSGRGDGANPQPQAQYVHRATLSAPGTVECGEGVRGGEDDSPSSVSSSSNGQGNGREASGRGQCREEREAAVRSRHSSCSAHRRLRGRPSHATSLTDLYAAGESANLSSNRNNNHNASNSVSSSAYVHRRYHTLDERMELDGNMPVPSEISEMSRKYEEAARAHSTSHSHLHSVSYGGLDEYGNPANSSGQPRSRFLPPFLITPNTNALNASTAQASLYAVEEPKDAPDATDPLLLLANSGDRGATAEEMGPSTPPVPPPGMERGGVVVLGSAPSPDLSSWYGQIRVAATGEMVPVGIDQFLPRGCIIRNTDWVLGAVLYTGKSTKMLLNLRPKPNKTTRMTRRLNQLNIFLFVLNQVLMFLLCGLAVWFTRRMRKKPDDARSGWTHWYLEWNLHRYSDAKLFWWRYLTNFVLLSFLIPMSLYVTLEFNKAMQMLMIGADKRMAVYDEFTGKLRKARPKTSELNCQLGQVEYIFTDKTGTLTENLMTYVGGYAAGIRHDERERPGGMGRIFYRKVGAGGGGGGGGGAADASSWGPGGGTAAAPTHSRHHGVLSLDDDGHTVVAPPPAGGVTTASSGPCALPAVYAQADSGDVLQPATSLNTVVRHAPQNSISVLGADPAAAPQQQQQHRRTRTFGRVDEVNLEDDDVYRYLRAMALCHTVVCFDGGEDGGKDGPDKDASSKQKKKSKKVKKGTKGAKKHRSKPHRDESTNGADDNANATREPMDSHDVNVRGDAHRSDHHHNHHHHHKKRKQKGGASTQATTGAGRPAADAGAASADSAYVAALNAELRSLRGTSNLIHVDNAVPAGPGGRTTPAAQHHAENNPSTSSSSSSSVSSRRGATSPASVGDGRSPGLHSRPRRSRHAQEKESSVMGTSAAALAHTRTLSASRLLHGRTGSASWYMNRYTTNATHATAAAAAAPAAAGGGAGVGISLEDAIDRSKLYEGQSLDEIALVSAARENGFTLFQRTAKQMFIKVAGIVVCYDIIAELEFTPQRKLMSILLYRNPLGDSEEAASSAAAGSGNAHYHRRTVGDRGAADRATTTRTDDNDDRNGAVNLSAPHGSQPLVAVRNLYEPFENGVAAEASSATTTTTTTTKTTTTTTTTTQPQQRHDTLVPSPPSQLPATALNTGEQAKRSSVGSGSTNEGPPDVSASHHESAVPPPYLLLVKGADSSMMDIMDPRNPKNLAVKPVFLQQLDDMASQGLRTLVLGQRCLTEAEVRRWLPVYHEAQCAMSQRSERLHAAYALLERDIDLVGTTAVEDKLQEGVPETLEFMSQAGIVVWMLTGDKRETAVTIAQTSGLVDPRYADHVCHLDLAELIAEETAAAAKAHHADPGSAASPSADTTADDDGSGGDADTSDDHHHAAVHGVGGGGGGSGGADREGNGSMTTSSARHAGDGGRAGIPRPSEQSPLYAEKCRLLDKQLAAAEQLCDAAEALYAEAEGNHNGNSSSSSAKVTVIVVDGKTLDFVFQDNTRAHRFFTLGSRCRSAVCCRMTPLQKAQIVHMFQKNMEAVALAIGDGANDVSMIQESKIGVGIMGLEGSQAELASDYAIPKFRFLKRLLMVHGRFSIFRDAHCIVYSLYKNVVLTFGMIAYSFYSAYSGQSFIDSWLLAMFSIFFCSLQPLMIGILDKDVEDELAETLPQLYPPLSRENMYFSFPYIIKWLVDGMVQGAFFFFFVIYTCALKDDLYPAKSGGIEDYGETFFTMLVLVVDLRVGVLVTYYMILFAIAVLFEIVALPVIQILYSEMHNLAGSNWCLYTAHALYGSGKFYLFLFFAVGVLVVYTMSTSLYIQMFYPWQNSGLAMMAAKRSPYRRMHHEEKAKLKAEYKQRVAAFLKAEQQPNSTPTADAVAADDDEEAQAHRRQAFPHTEEHPNSHRRHGNGHHSVGTEMADRGCEGHEERCKSNSLSIINGYHPSVALSTAREPTAS